MLPIHRYSLMHNDECHQRIVEAKKTLGSDLALLVHHYQRDEVFEHADFVGDSLKLSRGAARSNARYIVFCGVHFMAEVADVLCRDEQTVILPDLSAGCQLADTASPAAIESAWSELDRVLKHDARSQVMPLTYINSAASLKAFCGDRGGLVCTSSNARAALEWAWERRPKVLFFPDQHLGRYTAYDMGVSLDDMVVWDYTQPRGGLSVDRIKRAKLILWAGYCSVHQMFKPEHLDAMRAKYPDTKLVAHPECAFEVCQLADVVGSTEAILETLRAAPAGSRWAVATEFNLVQRIAREVRPKDVHVSFLSPTLCMCSTMYRIDQQHLAWILDNLVAGDIVNPIKIDPSLVAPSRLALDRMLGLSPSRQPLDLPGGASIKLEPSRLAKGEMSVPEPKSTRLA